MAYALALQIPTGKTAEVRRLTDECLGPRRAEFDDMMRRSHLTEEAYWLQRDSRGGDMLVIYGEDDLGDFTAIMASPETEFDRWYRDQVMAVFGIDPADGSSPPNEFLGGWKSS